METQKEWVAKEDENAKYFHNFANMRKIMNTSWEVQNAKGVKVKNFQEVSEV
jgi:hypothetical protein